VLPRYAFRLEDLRVFDLVRSSCHACGHKAIIPNAALLQGRPGYIVLVARKRLWSVATSHVFAASNTAVLEGGLIRVASS
jgi:hypothetical protein